MLISNRIKIIARERDGIRIRKYVADNRALWNLEYESEKAIKLCEEINKEWSPEQIKIKFFNE